MGSIRVLPPAGSGVDVTITRVNGTKAVTAYTDGTFATPISLPENLRSAKTYYLPDDDTYSVSLSIGGIDAGSKVVPLFGSQSVALAADVDLSVENIAEELGSSPQGSFASVKARLDALAPDVIAPIATGVAATDTTNLQTAIDSTPSGGALLIPRGHYKLNAALVVDKSMSINGAVAMPTYIGDAVDGGSSANGTSEDPGTPYLTGVVFEQTANGESGLELIKSGQSVHLSNIGILFGSSLTSTGHGIDATPAETYGTGNDLGVTDFIWHNILVYGHDGNHYALNIVNPQYGEISHLRSWKGGGVRLESNGNSHFYGNIVFINPYVLLDKAGTAGGFIHVSASNDPCLNLVTYIRPQVNAQLPATGSQKMYDDLAGGGTPQRMTVISPDFESGGTGATVVAGNGTTWLGDKFGLNSGWTSMGTGAWPYSSTYSGTAYGQNALAVNAANQNTGIGGGALRLNTSGTRNTAVGDASLYSTVSANDCTAVGANALLNSTGNSNTGLGSNAGKLVSTGINNTAVGSGALSNNATASGNTAVGLNAAFWFTSANNTAVGGLALNGSNGSSTGSSNTAVGYQSLSSLTTGGGNVAVGYQAGYTATPANATTTGVQQTIVGNQAGQASASQRNNITCIGYRALADGNDATALGAGASAGAAGAVAIGRDSSGGGASTTTANEIAIGTANHQIKISNNTTGAGSAALGSNSPATTNTAPYTWFKMTSNDGSTVYVPAWK